MFFISECGEICTAWLFSQRGRPLHSNLAWMVISHQPFLVSENTGLPGGENRIPLRSLVLTIPDCDGHTDGRIFRSIYSACKGSFAAKAAL